jgi:hypothetical protein
MGFINTNVEKSSGSLPDGRLVEAFHGNDYKYGPKTRIARALSKISWETHGKLM